MFFLYSTYIYKWVYSSLYIRMHRKIDVRSKSVCARIIAPESTTQWRGCAKAAVWTKRTGLSTHHERFIMCNPTLEITTCLSLMMLQTLVQEIKKLMGMGHQLAEILFWDQEIAFCVIDLGDVDWLWMRLSRVYSHARGAWRMIRVQLIMRLNSRVWKENR